VASDHHYIKLNSLSLNICNILLSYSLFFPFFERFPAKIFEHYTNNNKSLYKVLLLFIKVKLFIKLYKVLLLFIKHTDKMIYCVRLISHFYLFLSYDKLFKPRIERDSWIFLSCSQSTSSKSLSYYITHEILNLDCGNFPTNDTVIISPLFNITTNLTKQTYNMYVMIHCVTVYHLCLLLLNKKILVSLIIRKRSLFESF